MAWPTDLKKVECSGFNRAILPLLVDEIENGYIIWKDCNLFVDEALGKFFWKNCSWEMLECKEMVVSLKLVDGKLDDPDLTMMVLRAKVESC